MKRKTAILLLTILTVSLTGCGGQGAGSNTNSAASETEEGSQNEETKTDVDSQNEKTQTDIDNDYGTVQAEELTLEDGEAKLIYHDGAFITAVYHGPWRDIAATFENAAGDTLGGLCGYGHPSDGWTVIQCNEFAEGYTGDDIMLHVTDYDAEKNEDGTHKTQSYPLTGTLTKEEAEAIGLNIIADHICTVGADKPTYGSNNFTVPFLYIRFLDDYYDQSIEEIEGLIDSFSYYAEDGTPLEDCFEGYTMKREPSVSGTCISLYFYNDGAGNKEQNKEMCDKLRELKPYALYTEEDGTTQQFPFFSEE